jgi:excisionase family DNA binding protein
VTWYTPEDVAEITKHSPRTVQRWARERRVPHIRVGRLIRFTKEQVREIEQAYAQPVDRQLQVDAQNPDYKRTAVVVPMRRPDSAA